MPKATTTDRAQRQRAAEAAVAKLFSMDPAEVQEAARQFADGYALAASVQSADGSVKHQDTMPFQAQMAAVRQGLAKARMDLMCAVAGAKVVAYLAMEDGMSERQAAEATGLDRMTIRKLRGK